MIKYKFLEQRAVGFFYFPILEMAFGVFCIIAALVFLSLFLYFNHHQLLQELFDTVASLAIFAFLMFLGYNLARNYMYVQLNNEAWYFYQCMTSPAVTFSLKKDEFKGIRTVLNKETKDTAEFTEILLKTNGEDKHLYKTRKASEVEAILCALQHLYEENNEKVVKNEQN
jgi:hypothetical protein